MKRSWRLQVIVGGFAVAVVLSGCAGRGRALRSPQLDEERRQAKIIAVVPAAYAPKVIYQVYKAKLPLEALTEKQSTEIFSPLQKAIEGQGIRLNDPHISFALAEQTAAGSEGLTDGTVSVVRDAGPKAADAAVDRAVLQGRKTDMAIVVRINDTGFNGFAKVLDQKDGEKAPAEQGVDGAQSVKVEDDPMAKFHITGNITVVSVRDGAELLKERLLYFSRPRRISEWSKEPGAVQREIGQGMDDFKKRIAEYAFLLYDLRPDNADYGYEYCALKLQEPKMAAQPSPQGGIGKSMAALKMQMLQTFMQEFGAADSLQPVLKWEAFPRDRDRLDGPKGFVERVSDVTYDLRVWKGRNGVPEDLVYERFGIKAKETWTERMSTSEQMTATGPEQAKPRLIKEGTAEHKLETPLERATEYFWTVRARFKLDGKTRITMWSRFLWQLALYDALCDKDDLEWGQYYRFKTPYDAVVR